MFPTVAYDRCKVRFKFVTKLRVFFTIIIARESVILSDDRKSLDYSLCMYACDHTHTTQSYVIKADQTEIILNLKRSLFARDAVTFS